MPTSKKTEEKTAEPQAQTSSQPAKLTRSSSDRVICGVAAGIAEYLHIDPIIIRLLFVLLAISGGSGVLLYIILCLIMPEKHSAHKTTKEVIKENTSNLEETIEQTADNVESIAKQRNTQTWVGLGIIVVGVLLMLNNTGFVDVGHVISTFVRSLWPLLIIALGLVILMRK